MEYFENGDLQKYLTRPLPETEAKTIISQVLEGLKFMHDNGFVHRDLKPGNIMVVNASPDWFVKIADFGISKWRQQDVTSLRTIHRGTLGFAAPEAMGCVPDNEQKSYTASVDMWSLGGVTYRILTNATPFPNYFALHQYVMGGADFPFEGLQVRSVTDQVQQFIVALMSPDPMKRPDSTAANKHPWITTPLLVIIQNTESSSEEVTAISVASASWSSAIKQIETQTRKLIKEQRVNQVEEQADESNGILTVKQLEDATNIRPYARYCAPSVDECDDEPGVVCGKSLPRDFPYVLDDASLPSTPKSTGSHFSAQQSPCQENGIFGVSPGVVDEKVTLSNTALPGPPYTSQNGRNIDDSYTKAGQHEKFSRQVPRLKNRRSRITLQPSSGASMVGNGSDGEDDIKGESASSSAAEEQPETESDTDSSFEDFYDDDYESILLDYEVKGYRDSLSRDINLSATFVAKAALRR
ncbi:hypothetical protein Hte_002693 [Hypoxylon texense]